jgi:hypothetical protein
LVSHPAIAKQISEFGKAIVYESKSESSIAFMGKLGFERVEESASNYKFKIAV